MSGTSNKQSRLNPTTEAALDQADATNEKFESQSSSNLADSTSSPKSPHQPDPKQHGGESEQDYSEKQRDGDAEKQNLKNESSGNHDSGKELTPAHQDPAHAQDQSQSEKKGPEGGYDASQVPQVPAGYTVRITFHRATNLPIADLPTWSSDPYLRATLETGLPQRHKMDPPLTFRSRTIFKTTAPKWEEVWIVEHIPASGFKLKARVYDEDRGDSDDRLGNAHVEVGRLDEHWEGIHNQPYKIKKRMGSKRAYLLRAIAVCVRQTSQMSGDLYVSVEVLGRSPGENGGRAYTAGLNYWCKHYSPLLGRLTGSKVRPNDSDSDDDGDVESEAAGKQNSGPRIPGASLGSREKRPKIGKKKQKKQVGTYNFQANQFQLRGPVPPELYHRFVEFKPWIKSLFTSKGVRGLLMHSALHHQHAQVYNFNSHTKYGVFDEPCEAMTQRFLDLCHHDDGGRMFTYVLSLDGLMRFTETGKEFGIDMLSKHTMHSDASIYIAYSGEFFIRRRKDEHHHHRDQDPDRASETSSHEVPAGQSDMLSSRSPNPNTAHARTDTAGTSAHSEKPHNPRTTDAPPNAHSPAHYELVIDNDSGTYRPNASLLPLLHNFLSSNFPGLKIITLDCGADEELMNRLKKEQRDKKHAAQAASGGPIQYRQPSSASSSSAPSVASEDDAGAVGQQDAVEADVDDQLTDDAARREAGSGTGQAKASGSGAGDGDGDEDGPTARTPRHKINEAVLPFLGEGRARQHLTKA